MDLHLQEHRESGDIQRRVSRICNDQIIPALSKICDELSPEQGRLLVDNLVLDVGVITAHNLEQELPKRLYSQLKKEIKKLKLTAMFGPDVSFPQSVIQTDAEEAARGRVGLLIHFFRYGTVPWWNPYPNKDLRQWLRKQFTVDEHALIRAVGDEIDSSAFRSRVVRLFTDEHFQSFFRHYKLNDLFELYQAVKNEVLQANKRNSEVASWQQLRHPFFENLLDQLWTHNTRAEAENKTVPYIFTSTQKRRAMTYTIRTLGKSHAFDPNIIMQAIHTRSEVPPLFSPDEWEMVREQRDTHGSNFNRNNNKRLPSTPEQTDSNTDQETFIEIQNAGAVLLWTNFKTLFTALGYVKNKTFISEHTAHRAVHLLHFIVTGQELGKEHEWALNKILCGLPPGTFVPYEIKLTNEEKEEAEEMAKASIKNWRALKSTSLKGFRDTFLMRDGILSSDINGWRLQVEPFSYDILLDKLPWPISVINLPWNKHLIHVQW